MNTEQEIINTFYVNDNTKTATNLIQDLEDIQGGLFTTEQVKARIKLDFPNVTDWSF
tara:strand:- start:1698 stop:1868 length:171 start_codon:yes stop_codon:yes gene_type:complete